MAILAAVLFLLIAFAAPVFSLVVGLLGVLVISVFTPGLNEEEQLAALLIFEAVCVVWICMKTAHTWHERKQSRRRMRAAMQVRNGSRSRNLPVLEHNDTAAYRLLGVQPGCSPRDLHRAWLEAVKSCHPDRLVERDEKTIEEATQRLSEINTAYEQLKRGPALKPPAAKAAYN